MSKSKWVITAAVVAGIAMAGGLAAQTRTPQQRTAARQPGAAAPYNKILLTPAKLTATAPATYDAKFTTTKGEFVIRVTREWSPNGADRFYNLVKNGYYDGASFFRVVPGFVVQWGLSAYPELTQVWQRASITDDPVKGTNTKGFVTFAKSGQPNSRTTQVFINLRDNARLDAAGFSPFGEVVQGMDVVEQLYSGYGDGVSSGGRGPEQGLIGAQGKTYLDKDFPQLDSIKSAVIVGAAPEAPAKRTAPGKTPPAKQN